MVITPTAVFIHFHKTGGQFINRLLLQHVPGAMRIGYHLPRTEIPPTHIDIPVFGFVRNPWDWYVSWYAFNATTPMRNPIFRILSGNGLLGFDATIENLLRLGQADRKYTREIISENLPVTRDGNTGSGITSSLMKSIHEPERGYLTWLWRYMFFLDGNLNQVNFGRFENFRIDIIKLLQMLDVSISAEFLTAIKQSPPVNPSSHRDYRNYYNPELKQLVFEKDREFIEAFDYNF